MPGQSKVLSEINGPLPMVHWQSWAGSNDYQNTFDLESWRFETDKTDVKFRLIKLIPECCIQVIFGLIVGAIIHFSSSSLESSILSLFTVSNN